MKLTVTAFMGSLSFPSRVNVYDLNGQDDSTCAVYEMQYLLDLARLGYGICNVAGPDILIISPLG